MHLQYCLVVSSAIAASRQPCFYKMEETSKVHCDSDNSISRQLETLQEEMVMLRSKNDQLVLENQNLKNQIIDNDYERGYFVEEEVLQKLEEENRDLRSLLQDYYKGAFREWLEEVKKQVR